MKNLFFRAISVLSILVTTQLVWSQNVSATWGANNNSAWYTGSNWSGGSYAGIKATSTSNANVATFTSAFTGTTVGINIGTSNLSLGAISIDNTRTTALNIGNSSGTNGTMALYGATVNSVANVIIRNNGTGLFTLQASQNGNLGIVLSNATANIINIDNNGGVSITGVISGSGQLTKGGSGSGQLILAVANTYSGKTVVNSGLISTSGESAFGNAPGSFTADQITLNGGGLTTTGNINFNSTRGITLGASGGTFDATSGNTITLTNVVTGSGALTKTSSGTLSMAALHTYTGGTVITAGPVVMALANAMPSSGSVTMNGGTFSSGATAGFSQTLGTLSLTDNSTIALGTGNHSLSFAASNGQTWTTGKVLTITGWAGASYSTGTTSGTAGKIFVGSSASGLTAVQLSQIKFFDGTNYYAAAILSSGEIVPCLRFAITSISPASPSAGNTFSVTVQTQDYSGTARNAVNATGFTLSTNGNAGAISGTTTGTVAAGSNSFTISNAVVLAQGGTLVTITATRTSGDNTATGTSATFTVTCTPPSFTTNPATGAQSVCNGVGTFPTLTVAASGTSGYQWYSNASNNNTTGTIIGGATSASYTPDNTLVGTTYYYCVASSGTCTGTSNVSGGMTVNNPPSITTHPATGSQTICSGGTLSPSSLSVVANNAIRYPLELH